MIDGAIVACVSEERFSRIKNDERYPRRAIDAVLRLGGLHPSALDAVVYAGESFDIKTILVHKYSGFSVHDRLREQREYWFPLMYEGRRRDYLEVFRDKLDTEQAPGDWEAVVGLLRRGTEEAESRRVLQEFRAQAVSRHLDIAPERVHFADHHRAHGYYAYYGSPLRAERVLVLTADAWGDGRNATVSLAHGSALSLLASSDNFQLARLYRSMTLLLGMKPDEHEYKVMGLAPYAKPEEIEGPYQVFRETQYAEGLQFAYHTKPADLYVHFQNRLEGYRFDAIAGALQRYAEETLVAWTRNALRATGARQLVFGGGVGLNVKAMMHIAKLPEVEALFVCPSPSDESLAVGAIYVFMHDRLLAEGRHPAQWLKPLASAYLGPEASTTDVQDGVERLGRHDHMRVRAGVDLAYVAAQLAQGKIVGRCVGRSEFGARALGNRSILADPRQPGVIRRLNAAVKDRDFWMPFSPTVLETHADGYLVDRKDMPAPYMTLAFETTGRARQELIAGLHPADGTCRPQVLERRQNPAYYALIAEFERRTGVGGLLNTSFNVHGEPIVQTPADAARVFEMSDMDLLLLDDRIVEKHQPQPSREAVVPACS